MEDNGYSTDSFVSLQEALNRIASHKHERTQFPATKSNSGQWEVSTVDAVMEQASLLEAS